MILKQRIPMTVINKSSNVAVLRPTGFPAGLRMRNLPHKRGKGMEMVNKRKDRFACTSTAASSCRAITLITFADLAPERKSNNTVSE